MVELDIIVLFFSASIILGISPGPDNIFVLTQSAINGRFAGFIITLGLCTGLIIHTSAVALGVAAIFQASAIAFNILKFIGSAYLLFLAWKAFRSKPQPILGNNQPSINKLGLYRRGIIMNITNPKVSLFFLAFLPQFTDPSKGHLVLQMFMLGGIFIVATLIVFNSIGFFAGLIGEKLGKSEKAQTVLNRIAGIVFVALALRLATSKIS